MPYVVHNLLIIALWLLCYNNPMKHKRFGFTIVELIVVIVVIAILVSITSLAYRETQKNARNEARKTDVAVLMGAIEEYRADKGDYPKNTSTCDAPGTSTTQCWRDEIWTMLKDQGYLREIPHPDASAPTPAYNTAGGGKANYGISMAHQLSTVSTSHWNRLIHHVTPERILNHLVVSSPRPVAFNLAFSYY